MKTVIEYVKEYKKDPNCWPALWISGEPITEEEKKQFINMCLIK